MRKLVRGVIAGALITGSLPAIADVLWQRDWGQQSRWGGPDLCAAAI